MKGTRGPANPFQPGAGARPPLLVGRAAELALAGELLGSFEKGQRPPQGLLFYGPRGNGKTVLLSEIAEEARGRGFRVEELSAAAYRDPEALRQELRERTGLGGTRVTGVQAAGFGVSAEPGEPERNTTKLFAHWIGQAPTPLVILLDEAHAVETEAGRLFFDAVQSATRGDLPFLLVAAGTPDAPRRLRRAGTFTERALARVPVGRIERSEAVRALGEPARGAGLPMDSKAATLLARESQEYPYFIQLLGSAAWRVAESASSPGIGIESAQQGIEAARPVIQRFYAERFAEAREQSVHRALGPLAALVRQRGGRLDDDDLDEFLAMAPVPVGETELLDTLSDLGVLWEAEPSVWEMGIPSFADHILGRSSRLSPFATG